MLGGAWLAFGITIVEKSLTALLMPVGLIWLALLMSLYIAITRKQRLNAVIAGFCLALVWLFGNFFVSNALMKSLEQPFLGFEIESMEKLDVVVVLGGGTANNTNGQTQLNHAGDRVAVAAQVYLAGKTDRLICTGTQVYSKSPDDLKYGEQAKALLTSLGVEAGDIETVAGANTSQEMQNLKQWVADHPDQPRIGILTSAWHTSRAMRLAKAAGIDATPVPADFRTQRANVTPDWVIPSADNLLNSSLAMKEYLARLIGR